MKIDKAILGVAGELAVASELCRRNVYAQLTLGHQKKTDLLIFRQDDVVLKLEVKCKQGPTWPNCQGISSPDSLIVFVDFQGKDDTKRPDFYVLNLEDWLKLVEYERAAYLTKHPERVAVVEDGCLVLLSEINKLGRPYKGVGVSPKDVADHRDAWWKITNSKEKPAPPANPNSFLCESEEETNVLMCCALRVDGYRLLEEMAASGTQDFSEFTDPIVKTRELHADDRGNFLAMFALQRSFGKSGAENLTPYSDEHLTYRLLFLHLYRLPTPKGFEHHEVARRWERDCVPRLEQLAAAVRKTMTRIGSGPRSYR
jgi:hypothetical protein